VTAATGLRIRPATPDDVDQIHASILALAEFERARDRVTATPEMLAAGLFGERPGAEVLIAELDETPAGFALFYGTFSTWEGRPGIWLEDLFVPERHRGAGVGGALLARLAAIALERGCARLEWHALDWNEPALRFYERLGATRLSPWELHRLDGESLRRVAAGAA
jgi:GNAT superfamily N-acetyltransferase